MIEIFEYDIVRYQFREWAQSVIGIQDLEALHEHPCGTARLPGQRVLRFVEMMKLAYGREIREQFIDFVREYAVPRVPFVAWMEVFPTFRVHEHGQQTTSYMHRDRDYRQKRGTFKIWLPFTTVAGGGTLWVESEEGKNDLRPYDMEYGQALFFDSENLLHGCHFNDSGKTRVSVDFAVRQDPRIPVSPRSGQS
jgi:hypothetical protein